MGLSAYRVDGEDIDEDLLGVDGVFGPFLEERLSRLIRGFGCSIGREPGAMGPALVWRELK